jgi:hypothetical protein
VGYPQPGARAAGAVSPVDAARLPGVSARYLRKLAVRHSIEPEPEEAATTQYLQSRKVGGPRGGPSR